MADWLGKIHGSAKDAKSRASSDAEQRKAAGDSPKSVILNANDVHGEYDAYRGLKTTFGGGNPVNITIDHLRAFQHNIRTVKSKFKAGIRARQVIDLSLKDDIKRSNEQIRMAVPVTAGKEPGTGGGALVRFMTNASGETPGVTRHHVLVNFMDFSQIASSGAHGDARKSADKLRKQPLKIECTCGRWRFWYRYIATIGGFNSGRDETGFPKIRNPGLSGVACKHILRVMHEVESSPSVLAFLERLIQKARDKDDNKVNIRNSQKDAEAQAKEQAENGSDVGESTARREKWRAQAQARRDNAKKRLEESRKHQKDGTATRQAKAADRAAKAEDAYVQRAMQQTEKKYGFKLTDEQIQSTREKYRRDHAQ